jgi:predicted anti-sigma-YlaC factor YlaD
MQPEQLFPPICPKCRENNLTVCHVYTFLKQIAEDQDLSPEDKNRMFQATRDQAREDFCRHHNDIDFDYPGKKYL